MKWREKGQIWQVDQIFDKFMICPAKCYPILLRVILAENFVSTKYEGDLSPDLIALNIVTKYLGAKYLRTQELNS